MAAEQRLIDANALGRDAFHIKQFGKSIRCVVDWDDIEAAPTVDAVEVVRCKDCKHRHIKASCQGRSPEWYCPSGERMSEKIC